MKEKPNRPPAREAGLGLAMLVLASALGLSACNSKDEQALNQAHEHEKKLLSNTDDGTKGFKFVKEDAPTAGPGASAAAAAAASAPTSSKR